MGLNNSTEWFAYCPGDQGWNGCSGMNSFGDDKDSALQAVYEMFEIQEL